MCGLGHLQVWTTNHGKNASEEELDSDETVFALSLLALLDFFFFFLPSFLLTLPFLPVVFFLRFFLSPELLSESESASQASNNCSTTLSSDSEMPSESHTRKSRSTCSCWARICLNLSDWKAMDWYSMFHQNMFLMQCTAEYVSAESMWCVCVHCYDLCSGGMFL